MSERDLELRKVQKKIAKNTTKLKTAHQNAVLAEVQIKTCESQIEYQTLLYNDIVNKFKLEIEDAVGNAKFLHDNLEALLKEKETLHVELKGATHYGQVQCSHCEKYFTKQGLSRHENNCSRKPETKIDKKHGAEVKVIKDDIAARKLALKKELAAVEKQEENAEKIRLAAEAEVAAEAKKVAEAKLKKQQEIAARKKIAAEIKAAQEAEAIATAERIEQEIAEAREDLKEDVLEEIEDPKEE